MRSRHPSVRHRRPPRSAAATFSALEAVNRSAVNNIQQERRRTLRFPFEAPAEVSEETSKSRMPARVTEISLNGCFLQVGSPFPQGTSIFVRIFVEGSFFEAHATVVYSQPNIGMGIAFRDLKPAFSAVLKKWLLTAMLAKQKTQS
jgi:hypothetical protein